MEKFTNASLEWFKELKPILFVAYIIASLADTKGQT